MHESTSQRGSPHDARGSQLKMVQKFQRMTMGGTITCHRRRPAVAATEHATVESIPSHLASRIQSAPMQCPPARIGTPFSSSRPRTRGPSRAVRCSGSGASLRARAPEEASEGGAGSSRAHHVGLTEEGPHVPVKVGREQGPMGSTWLRPRECIKKMVAGRRRRPLRTVPLTVNFAGTDTVISASRTAVVSRLSNFKTMNLVL
jgi:hypothetical protein